MRDRLPFRTKLRFDIVIVGAGLAGAGLAAALRQSRYRIALVEGRTPAPAPAGWDSRVYALSPAAQGFLREIGAWPHLDEARLTPVYDMAIRGDAGGRLDFSAYDSGVGQLAWIVEAGLMQRELWEGVKRQGNVTLFCPAQPQRLDMRADAVSLGLTSG
jgi:2-polyprenyl-6-methoxyphenol hydroxylase-like FAD-dependent oxidoreductase